MDIAHELLTVLKDLAVELGHTPTKNEFLPRVQGAERKIAAAFKTFSAMVQAAGLESYNERRRRKIEDFDIRGRDIVEVMDERKPEPRLSSFSGPFKTILAIGDIHFPWAHKESLEKVYAWAKENQPGFIVQLGDLLDMFAFASFPKSMNLYTPDQELEMGQTMAREFWAKLTEACPSAKCYQLIGNHSLRPMKRVMESTPALESLLKKSIEPLFEFPGVTTIKDYREVLDIQGISFHHGYLSTLGGHRDAFQSNTVCAHSHKGGVVVRPLKGKTIWELNAGFLGDQHSKVFGYTPTKTETWTLGFGVIDSLGPRFIPL